MAYCKDVFLKPGNFCNPVCKTKEKNQYIPTPCLSLIFSFLKFDNKGK